MFQVAMRICRGYLRSAGTGRPRVSTPVIDVPQFPHGTREDGGMSQGDLNPRPEQFDDQPHAEARRYDKGGITAGRIVNLLVLLLVLAAVCFAVYVAAVAFVPRWWANQVADQVGGSQVRGIVFGLGVGSIFTFVPLLVWVQVRRGFFNWVWRIIVSLFALALAAPNWLTMSVLIGTSPAAVDGREILRTSAPGFRNGSAAGAIVGAVLAILIIGTSLRLSQRRRQVVELRGRVNELELSRFPTASGEVNRADETAGTHRAAEPDVGPRDDSDDD
jgi:hypothetical protein